MRPIMVESFHDFNMPDCHILIAEGDTVLVKDGEGTTCEGTVVGEQRIGHRYAFKVRLDYDTWQDASSEGAVRPDNSASGDGQRPSGDAPSGPPETSYLESEIIGPPPKKKPARKRSPAPRRSSSTG